MVDTVVYVSRIGRVLEARHLSVPRLRERLAARGHSISRGALARLVSDEPIEEIRLSVIRPVLDELGLSFEQAFDEVCPADFERQRLNRSRARSLAGLSDFDLASASTSEATAADPTNELREVIARSLKKIQSTHPEIVDQRGRIRRRALAKAIEKQLEDKATLSSDEYSQIVAAGLDLPISSTLLRDADA
jgi:hypothetical protein